MPTSKYKFHEPVSYDHIISEEASGNKVGELRLKPSSILWKPKGQQQFFVASLDEFSAWIVAKNKRVSK